MGNAPGFLFGIHAKRVSYNGSCADVSDPQSARPGLFFFWRTRLLFHRCSRCCGRYRKSHHETLEWEEEEEAGDGVLELLVSSHLLVQFLSVRCLLLCFLVRLTLRFCVGVFCWSWFRECSRRYGYRDCWCCRERLWRCAARDSWRGE